MVFFYDNRYGFRTSINDDDLNVFEGGGAMSGRLSGFSGMATRCLCKL